MCIDSHQHFWEFDPVRDSWITDDMKRIRKNFMPTDLASILKHNDIDGCVAVQADQSEKETDFLLKLANENNFIKGVVGWVDLLRENVDDRLTHFSKHEKLKGIRHIVQAEPLGFMEQKNFQRGIRALEKYNLTYDILIKPPQLKEAISLAHNFPNQKFVLDHLAKPMIGNKVDEKWEEQIKELAKSEHVFCKVSGMVTETPNFKWKPQDFTPYLDIVTNAFGVERLMFGSDWPVCLVAAEYNEVLKIITNYFNENQLKGIMGGNAKRFYNIN